MSAADTYWTVHRGGVGPVILAIGFHEDGAENGESRTIHGIFGAIENAEAWADTFDDEWTFLFAPYVVDEPGFGNSTIN
jgi:hypothetical protein